MSSNDKNLEYDEQALDRYLESVIEQKTMSAEIRKKIFEAISVERERQINKWGLQLHDDSTWSLILGEELGEVCKAIVDQLHTGKTSKTKEELTQEIVQVAAVAVAWLECHEMTK